MENINKEKICITCINCKCNQIIDIDKIKKIKICKICNSSDELFKQNRRVCNKCLYKQKNKTHEQQYFKQYYIDNREKLLEKQANQYKKKILNLIV